MRSELDCPVPRLTLLFFGAAKDVPEAAKMVTARTAPSNIPTCNATAKPGPAGLHADRLSGDSPETRYRSRRPDRRGAH
jgi:hypothetical protein